MLSNCATPGVALSSKLTRRKTTESIAVNEIDLLVRSTGPKAGGVELPPFEKV
jgi:hypothetical protein